MWIKKTNLYDDMVANMSGALFLQSTKSSGRFWTSASTQLWRESHRVLIYFFKFGVRASADFD